MKVARRAVVASHRLSHSEAGTGGGLAENLALCDLVLLLPGFEAQDLTHTRMLHHAVMPHL
jgi:hypothetical protein